MRKLVLLIIALAFTQIILAQKIDVKKDIVYVDGKETFKINAGGLSGNSSVENMEGKKLIFLRIDESQIRPNSATPSIMTFAGYPNLKAIYQESIPMRKMLAKEILQNDLIIDGKLNEENVYRYCNATMPTYPQQSYNNNNDGRGNGTRYYTPVARNTEANIFTTANEIKQDFKLIGKYKTTQNAVNGKIQKKILINGYDNTPVAEVKYYMFEEEAEIFLFSKEKSSTITIPNANDFQVLDDVVKYLIELRQL